MAKLADAADLKFKERGYPQAMQVQCQTNKVFIFNSLKILAEAARYLQKSSTVENGTPIKGGYLQKSSTVYSETRDTVLKAAAKVDLTIRGW